MTVSQASQQNVESRVVIPDFLSWLTLEIEDEIVYNPSSSKDFDRHGVTGRIPSRAASMSMLKVSMNSRNTSDLGFSSASRSTFLDTTFPTRAA